MDTVSCYCIHFYFGGNGGEATSTKYSLAWGWSFSDSIIATDVV